MICRNPLLGVLVHLAIVLSLFAVGAASNGAHVLSATLLEMAAQLLHQIEHTTGPSS